MNSFLIVLMNTGRTLRSIVPQTQKASVNVTSKLKLMQTSAIEFMRAINSSGLARTMLMNIGRRLRRNEGIILMN